MQVHLSTYRRDTVVERNLKLSNLHKTFIMYKPCEIESYPTHNLCVFPEVH